MTETELMRCCGSREWARRMFQSQPFPSREVVFAAADRIWWTLKPEDWVEAFKAHPKIGAHASSEWSRQEQAGARGASAEIMRQLADANREYEERFGYIFIVCASGKSADQMLASLRERLNNPPDAELRIAAGQQWQITRLRLEKLLG